MGLRGWTRLGLAAAVVAALGAGAIAEPGRVDVIELFTSQGCSSCPEADRILGELSKEPGTLALSFNVDYWDYLGWKDTLATPDFTARQKAYAHARGDRAVYTPQAVVNGMIHAVGSDRDGLEKAVRSTGEKLARRAVDLTVERSGDSVVVHADKARGNRAPRKPATLWFVTFDDTRTIEIDRGENVGRTITYYNVVRHIEPIGEWSGEPVSVSVPMPKGKGKNCAVILQEGSREAPGAILAAARP